MRKTIEKIREIFVLSRLLPSLILLLLTTSCTVNGPREELAVKEVQKLQLTGPISNRLAEISGLTWFKDYLIFLPQYPNFPKKSGGGRIFALHKRDIYKAITDGSVLHPLEIEFKGPNLQNILPGFEGYEAIVFSGNTAFLTIEVEPSPGKAYALIVTASMAEDLSSLQLSFVDIERSIRVESPSHIPNMSEESLVIIGHSLYSIHEANGKSVNQRPVAHGFSLRRSGQNNIPFPALPYRVTDATAADKNNKFWVINYFYRGDKKLAGDPDILQEDEIGLNPGGLERIVELQYEDEAIKRTKKAAITLKPLPGKSRNWEGIVRLEDKGFLLVSDKFPTTEFAFVPVQ
ncbi:hypothetical protein [Desulfotalea psychrophila]|uniref:Lipoprotein n=1 Tax=Desulfotalea psychrophila (strain LSv54 / DSM 12343) TaxID=177439 RepID=Q6AMK1_DESPS|nr:hypothetical protein [Desulfotalea psychrophila]CAG36424.1 unknown protein [Desulfotalea psychrophila LSv54]